MFTVARSVTNSGAAPVTLHPYALLSRWGTPSTMGFYILHEGPIGVLGGTLHEIDYDDLQETATSSWPAPAAGWASATSTGWPRWSPTRRATSRPASATRRTRAAALPDRLSGQPLTVAPGRTRRGHRPAVRRRQGGRQARRLQRAPRHPAVRPRGRLRLVLLPDQADLPRPGLLLHATGNYGIAILMLTLIVKVLFFPLANKSYKAMSQMKKLQPEMMKLRERYGEDKRQDEPGADGALQAGEGQPGLGLPADRRADPGLLRALQGAVRLHRDAARAVLRLDPRPLGAPIRPASSTCSA